MTPTTADLMQYASPKVRERALSLPGKVRARTRTQDTYHARVQGSERAPYRAWVNLAAGEWSCSCQDEYNAMCKHVYALLLVMQNSPESFEVIAARKNLPNVKGWADGDVERLLDRLLDEHPQVVTDWARVVAEERFDVDDW